MASYVSFNPQLLGPAPSRTSAQPQANGFFSSPIASLPQNTQDIFTQLPLTLFGAVNQSVSSIQTPQQAAPATQVRVAAANPNISSRDALDIFVVDDFTPERDQQNPNNPGTFFNHGETVVGILEAGGGNPALASRIQTHSVNTDLPGQNRSRSIADALDQIAQIAQTNPDQVDAVNISQAATLNGGDIQRVRQSVQNLLNLGVPVVIAAGNNGLNTPNTLAPNGAFIVQSTTQDGSLRSDSGPGNLRAFAPDATSGASRQTSFATPQVTTLAAQFRAMGLQLGQIRQSLANLQSQNGGFVGGQTPVRNFFS